MINNDTKPPKNNYTEKNREEVGYLNSATERLAKCVLKICGLSPSDETDTHLG